MSEFEFIPYDGYATVEDWARDSDYQPWSDDCECIWLDEDGNQVNIFEQWMIAMDASEVLVCPATFDINEILSFIESNADGFTCYAATLYGRLPIDITWDEDGDEYIMVSFCMSSSKVYCEVEDETYGIPYGFRIYTGNKAAHS
jgi:hypothetical protein